MKHKKAFWDLAELKIAKILLLFDIAIPPHPQSPAKSWEILQTGCSTSNHTLLRTCYEAQHSLEFGIAWMFAMKPAQRVLLPLSIRWAEHTGTDLHITTGADTAFKWLVVWSIVMPNSKVILLDIIRVLEGVEVDDKCATWLYGERALLAYPCAVNLGIK